MPTSEEPADCGRATTSASCSGTSHGWRESARVGTPATGMLSFTPYRAPTGASQTCTNGSYRRMRSPKWAASCSTLTSLLWTRAADHGSHRSATDDPRPSSSHEAWPRMPKPWGSAASKERCRVWAGTRGDGPTRAQAGQADQGLCLHVAIWPWDVPIVRPDMPGCSGPARRRPPSRRPSRALSGHAAKLRRVRPVR